MTDKNKTTVMEEVSAVNQMYASVGAFVMHILGVLINAVVINALRALVIASALSWFIYPLNLFNHIFTIKEIFGFLMILVLFKSNSTLYLDKERTQQIYSEKLKYKFFKNLVGLPVIYVFLWIIHIIVMPYL